MKKENFEKAKDIDSDLQYLEYVINACTKDVPSGKKIIIEAGSLKADLTNDFRCGIGISSEFQNEVLQAILKKAKERRAKLQGEFNKL